MRTWILQRLRKPPSLQWQSVFRRTRRRGRELGFSLRRCRPESRQYPILGDLYTVDLKTGAIKATHVRLWAIAVALDVMAPDEQIIWAPPA